MPEINLVKQSLDNLIIYSVDDLPLPNLLLMSFNRPLSRGEHYSLCKLLYPCTYIDGETASEWHLANAHYEEGFAAKADDMILVERLPSGETVYHWSFARNWQTEKLWAFDKGILPDNLENDIS
jgi:hypothetical protein